MCDGVASCRREGAAVSYLHSRLSGRAGETLGAGAAFGPLRAGCAPFSGRTLESDEALLALLALRSGPAMFAVGAVGAWRTGVARLSFGALQALRSRGPG